MIVRSLKKSHNYKSTEHLEMSRLISKLTKENQYLKMKVRNLEMRIGEIQSGKTKYKSKYKTVKEKV